MRRKWFHSNPQSKPGDGFLLVFENIVFIYNKRNGGFVERVFCGQAGPHESKMVSLEPAEHARGTLYISI